MMTTQMTPPVASGDEELVGASLAGNREAFGQIVARYQALVCSLAYSATGSLSQSEDLAQDTFIAAWKHLSELREPAKLRSWLCGIARNIIRDFLRTQRREPSHRAEALEDITEQPSREPLPGERAISREESDILWRVLEQMPATYREPLVLFYWQHQSVGAVATELDLTQEAVRQRLARDRKLLREDVLAFVEDALERTAPGTPLTESVVSALPLAVTSAKAASIGVAAAKGGSVAKGALSATALGALAGLFGAVLFSLKTAVDETKSPRERRLMVRTGWFQLVFFALSMGATLYGLPRLSQHPWALGAGLALLLLANVITGVLLFQHTTRRRIEIVMEEGVVLDGERAGSAEENNRKAFRKTVKLMIPLLLMFVAGGIGMPWKQHWIRCAVVVAGETLMLVWGFRRFQKMHSFQVVPGAKPSRIPPFGPNPIILFPAIVFGSGVLAAGLVLFFNPAGAEVLVHRGPWLRNMGLSLLAAMAGYAIFAAILVKKRGAALGLTTQLTGEMMVKAYAPLFEQINLSPDQSARLQDLIAKKNPVNMEKGLALMNPKLDAARRAALIGEMKNGREVCDTEIRTLLGEREYQVFDQFEKSLPDRLMIGTFNQKAAATGAALSDTEQQQLLQAIGAARARYHWSTDLSRRIQNPADLALMFSHENIATFARKEAEFDRQFLTEAQTVLTPGQFAAFQPFQAEHRQAKIASMKTTAKMFTREKS